jgi:putative membrane protein
MKVKADDKKFLQDAAMGGMAEVAMGKLAAEKGSTDAVKQFGQKMVDDHTKTNDELKQVASAQSITIPGALDSRHQSRIDKLSKLSGAAFDKAYAKAQVKDHEEDLRAFQDEAQNGNNSAVKDFANKTLPTLQEHLTMAKDLSKGKMASNSADRSQ